MLRRFREKIIHQNAIPRIFTMTRLIDGRYYFSFQIINNNLIVTNILPTLKVQTERVRKKDSSIKTNNKCQVRLGPYQCICALFKLINVTNSYFDTFRIVLSANKGQLKFLSA